MDPRLLPLLEEQAGVISRRQALLAGLAPHDLDRLLRRRLLCRVHPGVFVDHTGEPTWLQRSWAAVLVCWPAALAGRSAIRAVEGPGSRQPVGLVDLVVPHGARPAHRRGIRVRASRHLDERVLWHTHPPRQRYEEAVLDVVAELSSVTEIVRELSDAVRGRRTTAARLLEALARRQRMPQRQLVHDLLRDVADGTHSVLEHGYLTLVERPHGLTGARRQRPVRVSAGSAYLDVDYLGGIFVLELDGRLTHGTSEQRDRDMDRDLDAAVDGKRSVRLGFGQVFDRPCLTAARLDVLLRRLGWEGAAVPCGPGCPVGKLGR